MDGTENKQDTGAARSTSSGQAHSAGSGQAEYLPAASANNQGTSEKAQTYTRTDIDKAEQLVSRASALMQPEYPNLAVRSSA